MVNHIERVSRWAGGAVTRKKSTAEGVILQIIKVT